ncbi:methyltransferase domain-containing protein [Gelidibacter salicanalis]|uniref:Methyltransferase domain-containing protein n=1 Tax=Gelidibacter salicanalis TaxID=291193 RepID=A0A5C7ALE3_9FLAO|nr:fused MFS/spermidine synthase [Gelidibacter salicanalis]TXE08589.1 methyltransferase domain-containing protein [Gelidibacter salicanalis]
MAKLLSYFYPLTKKVHSDHSGTLEITWYNGRKHLDTKNANYSYGSLQRILKFGLEKINLKQVNSVLLLGLGGGSVVETLRHDFSYSKTITAVDIDPVVIDIAKNEFNLKDDAHLHVVCEDALHYMQTNNNRYDLIIIDLFIDTEVPMPFLALPFWKQVLTASTSNGAILFNASLEKTKSTALIAVIEFLKSHKYHTEVFEKVNNTNTLILSKGL